LGIVGWKGKASIRAYVPRNERLHYLRLIGADTTQFEVNKFQGQRDGGKAEEDSKNDAVDESKDAGAGINDDNEADGGDDKEDDDDGNDVKDDANGFEIKDGADVKDEEAAGEAVKVEAEDEEMKE
jgi:hypothetical protein